MCFLFSSNFIQDVIRSETLDLVDGFRSVFVSSETDVSTLSYEASRLSVFFVFIEFHSGCDPK